ncbi:unnamed protein product [Spirodela intermedia]|uniref:Uncharacterized protein n=1 Tax=Spirodela intermedia TaxID=51605 RepID=A0ABN7E7X1_SPIIN|nr:unnamed protein product [Spirodela intermedia]
MAQNRHKVSTYRFTKYGQSMMTLRYYFTLKSSWRRDYLEHIKIAMDQVPLNLRLVHNEIYVGDEINKSNHNFAAMDVDSDDDDVYHIPKLKDSS